MVLRGMIQPNVFKGRSQGGTAKSTVSYTSAVVRSLELPSADTAAPGFYILNVICQYEG